MAALASILDDAPQPPPQSSALGDSTPAPYRGWNARESMALMDPGDAVELINWFPTGDKVRIRKGSAAHATGIGSSTSVESLMAYSSPTVDKIFAAASSSIYDVTLAGAVGAADITGLTNARWQWVNHGNAASNNLVIVNGEDSMRLYNGSAWSTPTVTGATSSTFINVTSFARRLWFTEVDTLTLWYLNLQAVSGPANPLRFDPYCKKGGFLMAAGSWTRDGGNGGFNDILCAFTSNGELLAFSGSDPSNPATFTHLGTFTLAPPIDRRCMLTIGGELILLTSKGAIAVSDVLPNEGIVSVPISDRIDDAWETAFDIYGDNWGWEISYFPTGEMILVNIPRSTNSKADQYVMNTKTRAWCRFKDWNINCMVESEKKLYGGTNVGTVLQLWTGTDDSGSDINNEARTAFFYTQERGRLKKFTMVRPNFLSDGVLPFSVSLDVNFENNIPGNVPTATALVFADWTGNCAWDACFWADTPRFISTWLTVSGVGQSGSIHIKGQTNDETIFWVANDWVYQVGNFV
jgi:hypothetical protein